MAKLQKLFTPISKCRRMSFGQEVENLIQDSGFELQKLEKFSLYKPLSMYKGVALCKK